jgi:tetratricopeptide (TPR) repeat protein
MKTTGKRIIFGLVLLALAASACAQSPREQLKQMVEQLQKAPGDNALRERIIKLAPTLKPPPVSPDTAIAFEGRAQFAFRSAKSGDDFLAAAQEYEKAVAAAPWVPGYYSDLCTIYEKAGKYEDAKRNCGFYLIGLSDPAQLTDVKRRIAGLEFGIEKMAAEKRRAAEEASSPRGRAAAMLAVLNKQYPGPVRKLLICGVLLNQYWQCTDEQARGSNWVDSTSMNAQPPPKTGPVKYRIVGAESDLIEIKLGDYGWAGDAFRQGCAKPNGTDPNSMSWVNCPGSNDAGRSMNVTVLFMTDGNGSPLIEYRDSCGGSGCRRAQFTLQPSP